MSVIKIHKITVIPLEEGGTKEERDKYNNINISDLALCTIIPHQLKKIPEHYKVMWGCDCFISVKSMHYYLFKWCDSYLKKLKDKSHNGHNRRSGEMTSNIFETYKSAVIMHGLHIQKK